MTIHSGRSLARGRLVLSSRLRLQFRISVVLAALVALRVLEFGTAISARLNRTTDFNIEPKQPESFLMACPKHAHIQIVIAQDADGEMEMSGTYEAGRNHAALDMLFGKCGLRYAVIGNSVIVIRGGQPLKG